MYVFVCLYTESAGELSIHSFLPESCSVNGKEEMILLTGRLPKGECFCILYNIRGTCSFMFFYSFYVTLLCSNRLSFLVYYSIL